MAQDDLIRSILTGTELRSASFIVTLYGDVAVPRGGVLWTGTLIEICARVGISESLVRTAVSRLVTAPFTDKAKLDEKALDDLIAANPAQVEKAKVNAKLAGWFTGQVLKATGGKADPAVVNAMVAQKLGL